VIAVRDPFDPNAVYAAISNAGGEFQAVPDDLLLRQVVDQSPLDQPPRNMIIEFDEGASAILIQPASATSKRTRPSRKSLDKPASALKRKVLHTYLPAELMDRIRMVSKGDNAV